MPQTYVPSAAQGEPPPELRARVEAALGRRWASHARPRTGLSAAHRFVVRLADGEAVFVKAATDDETARWLRDERRALAIAPADLAPKVLVWLDGDPAPLLITEAFVEGHWPAGSGVTQWRDGDIDAVLAAIRRLAASDASGLSAAKAEPSAEWRTLLDDPAPFLALNLCSAAWLAAHGEALAAAEARVDRSGDALVHGDMRSDNIWLGDGVVKFVDWPSARRGAAETDLAAFLPATVLEGGPAPQDVFPEGGCWGAAQAGNLARRAARETHAQAWLRRVLRRMAAINLDWAAATLDLPSRDGPPWPEL